MATTKERLRILDNQELYDLYGLPRFFFEDRCQYFSITNDEKVILCSGLIAPDTLIRDNIYQLLKCPVLLDHYRFVLTHWMSREARLLQIRKTNKNTGV